MTGEGVHRHLELRDLVTGKRTVQLTSGDWEVEAIAGVDEDGGAALFLGTKDGPLERQLYRVPSRVARFGA